MKKTVFVDQYDTTLEVINKVDNAWKECYLLTLGETESEFLFKSKQEVKEFAEHLLLIIQ